MTALADWLLAQIAADEAVARHCELGWTAPTDVIAHDGSSAVLMSPGRLLAQCVAHRKIVELHKAWPVLATRPPTFETVGDPSDVNTVTYRASQQIMWLTEQEYRTKFGSEPPTAPMLRALAGIYRGRPGWQEDWAMDIIEEVE